MNSAWKTQFQIWKISYRNLWRNKRRTLSTGIAIAAGYIGLILLSAYIYRVQKGVEMTVVRINHKGHLAIFKQDSLQNFHAKPPKYILTKADQENISMVLGKYQNEILYTGKYLNGTGLLSNGQTSVPVVMMGFEPDTYAKIYADPQLRRWTEGWEVIDPEMDYEIFKSDPSLISITKGLGELISRDTPFSQLSEDQKSVQIATQNYFRDLNAVNATLGPKHSTGMALAEDTSLYAPLSLIQELLSTDGIQYWALFLKHEDTYKQIKTKLEAEFLSQNLPFQIFAFDHEIWGAYYVGTMDFLYVIGAFFIFLICGAVALSIVNSTGLGIMERLKEIGTLRALGFNRTRIINLFIRENFILSFFAVLIGQVLALIIIQAVNSADIAFHPPGTQGEILFRLLINAMICLIMAILVMIINVATTYLVVQRVTRQQIVKLLLDSGG